MENDQKKDRTLGIYVYVSERKATLCDRRP